jgi:hypothetical protein
MNKTLPILDLAVLVVYLVTMVAMGVWFGRKNKTPRPVHESRGRDSRLGAVGLGLKDQRGARPGRFAGHRAAEMRKSW